MSQYPYDQLDNNTRQFRLLTLQPGKFSDPIHCFILNSHLDENLVYDALSYTWGIRESKTPINVHGQPFDVTENLYVALQHLRSEDREVLLWVDALCINQSDLAEKSHQVQQMRQIYERAASVIAWLGVEKRNSSLAIKLAETLDVDAGSVEALRRKITCSENVAACLGLEGILKRAYWRRVWILQELVVASKVVIRCGFHSLHWDQLIRTSACLNIWHADINRHLKEVGLPERVSWRPHKAHRIDNTRGIQVNKDRQRHLLNLWSTHKTMAASDPRDKVFALLGLADDLNLYEPIPIDYSLPVNAVFQNFVHALQNKKTQDHYVLDLRKKTQTSKSLSAGAVANHASMRHSKLLFVPKANMDPTRTACPVFPESRLQRARADHMWIRVLRPRRPPATPPQRLSWLAIAQGFKSALGGMRTGTSKIRAALRPV